MSTSPDLIAATFKMILSLAVVLALVWMLQRWIRRAMPGAGSTGGGRLIRVLGTHYLGVKKSIALVKVPGSILVLGLGGDQINLLTRIEDPAVIAGVETAGGNRPVPGFKEQLQRFIRPNEQSGDPANAFNPLDRES